MKEVMALIGDIAMSKKIEDRENFQNKISLLFKKVSAASKDYLHSPYTLTLGDEFQAVYRTPDSIMTDIWKIIEALYPHRARFAVGMDMLSTKINPNKAIGMDGPAFYYARDGIEELKQYSRTIIQFYGKNIRNLNLIDQYLILLSGISSRWKHNTIKIFNGLLNKDSLEKISNNTGISKRAVYKNIKNNYLEEIIDLQREITKSLSDSIGA